MFRNSWQSLVFINSISNTVLNKKPSLKIGSDASSGGQEKLKYFNYFPSHPVEATLSIWTYCFMRTCVRKFLFLSYTLFIIRWSPKEIT